MGCPAGSTGHAPHGTPGPRRAHDCPPAPRRRTPRAANPRQRPRIVRHVHDTPVIRRVLETALYVDDMPRAVAFYRDVLGLRVMDGGDRLTSLDAGAGTVLLLFLRGATRDGLDFPGGRIPPHDGEGPLHVAFAVDDAALDAWLARFAAHGVAVEVVNRWRRGGRSAYVRDPDGHSVEIATPGVWETY